MPDATPSSQNELIRIRPTLIIGLGGTGGDVILRIRKRFFEKYGGLAEFPLVAYLWIDTDNTEKHILAKEMQHFISLADTEKKMVTVGDTTLITQHLKEAGNEHIDKWWYPGLNALGQMNEGAGQIRPYSRLAFFHHYKDRGNLRAAIQGAGARIRDPFVMQRMMESPVLKELGILTQVEFTQPTNVYVICSIAGGTGSGMFLDTAFSIKDIFKEGNVTTTAYLVLPDHFGPVANDKMRANAYAALKEINYYKYGVPTFDTEWENGFPVRVPIPPFDYCYVFDNQNQAGQITGAKAESQELVFELLADNIFKDFSHGDFADQKRSARVNLRQFMSATYDYKHPRFKQRFIQRYQSAGLSTISVPHARIMTACAYRLAGEVINQWGGLTTAGFNAADIPRMVDDRFLPAIGAVEDDKAQKHDILFALLDTSGLADPGQGKASGLLNQLAAFRDQTMRDVAHHVPQQQRKRLRDFLEIFASQEREKLRAEEISGDADKWGYYPRIIRANLEALVTRLKEKLRKEGFNLIDERHESIGYTQAVLKETAEALKRTMGTLNRKVGEMDALLSRRVSELGRRYSEISAAEFRKNYDGRKNIILEYLTERFFDTLVGDNQNPGELRALLQKRAYQEGVEVCKRVLGAIQGEERPDGRRQGGLTTALDALKNDLETLRQEFQTGFNYFSQKDAQTLSLVLYEPSDIENVYYPGYIKSKDDVAAVGNAALRSLERSITGLGTELAAGRKDVWKRALTTEARKRFAHLPNDFHVLKVFYRKFDEATIKNHLVQIFSRSAVWVTPSGAHGAFQLPSQQLHKMIGVPVPNADMAPQDAAEIESLIAKLKDTIAREIQTGVKFYNVPESGELLFYQEAGGFPINYMQRLADLRKCYLKLYTAGEPLHIDSHDKKFPDLAIYSPQERQGLEEAYECYVFGCLFDELQFAGGEYTWMKKDGFRARPYPLGDRHMLLVKLSTDDVIRAEVYDKLKKRREEFLGNVRLEDLATYLALLDAYKLDAYGDRWGKVQNEDELDFDNMMIVKTIQDEEKRVEASPVAQQQGPALAARAAALADALPQVARRRADEKWALVRKAGAPA
ncbi:MAG TPA: tubulin-like doman-containing protein [Candidatus Xenobia bacterium]